MGGLWKLAAMSAVIGAGLVVVWQAQLGLQSNGDPEVASAPALSPEDLGQSIEASDSPTLRSDAIFTPEREGITSQTALDVPAVGTGVNASIPPETDPQLLVAAAPDSGSKPLPAATSTAKPFELNPKDDDAPGRASLEPAPSRGINFRQSELLNSLPPGTEIGTPGLNPAQYQSAAETSLAPQPLAENAADGIRLATADEDFGALLPVPENNLEAVGSATGSNIQLTAGEAAPVRAQVVPRAADVPESDPFFDAAPPMLERANPETMPTGQPGAIPDDFDPFGAAPANTTPPSRIPVEKGPANLEEPFDPFGDSSPRMPESVPAPMPEPTAAPLSDTPALPTELDDKFDPFGADSAPPVRTPPSRTANPPLPLDLDADSAPEPSNPNPPVDNFDPFGTADPGPPAAMPERVPASAPEPLKPLPPIDSPLENERPLSGEPSSPAPVGFPAIDSQPIPEPAPRPAPAPTADLFQGDGELTKDAPRGVQEPRLTIEKFAPATAVLGQPLIYSVIVKNVGGSAASQVTVEDRIPKGSRLVGTAPQAEMIEKRLVWRKLGTLQPGEERKISIKVIPEEEGAIGSVARVSFMAEVAAEIVIQAPKLSLNIQPISNAKVGATLPLVFNLSNPGDGLATNVVLRCILPDGLKHPAGNDLEYSVGELKPKENREIRLEVSALKPGTLTHQTIISADGNISMETKSEIEVIGEDLLLTRSGHDRVYLGRSAEFTNSVTNEGAAPVASVELVESVPRGFEFVSASHGGTYSSSERLVRWKLGALPSGGAATVSVSLEAREIGQFDATVTATGPSGSQASVQPTVTIEGFPALALQRLGENRLVGVGETITTKLELQNRGTAAAKAVAVTIDLPSELRLVSASGPSNYRVDGQRLIFEALESVAASQTTAYELVLEARAPGDTRLEMQLSAEHLRRPVRHDEALQILGNPQ